MKRKKVQPIGDALREYLKAMRIEKKIDSIRIIKEWKEMVGVTIERLTENIYFKDGKLFIKMKSSIVRHELLMAKNGMIESLNKKIGYELIKDIIIR